MSHVDKQARHNHASLRALLGTLSRTDIAETILYVLLSLACALAGSAAAVLLVPMVQPGHPLVLGGHAIDIHGSIETHALLFAAMTACFAVLRWQAARLAAHLASRYGMRLRRAVHARLIDASLPALADATSATIDLARETSAPVGRVVLASTRITASEPSLPLRVPSVVPTADVLRSVGNRVGAGVKPLSGSARGAFGFLIRSAPVEPRPEPPGS